MKKLLLLLSFVFLTSCASLDFQLRTLNTIGMYDGIYYNSPQNIPNNFYFFQPNYHNDFWWNYSLNNPYGSSLTYNWRYTRWNSNQWLFQPNYVPIRYRLIVPNRVVVPNRGRRNTTIVETPQRTNYRTQIRVPNQPTRITTPRTPIIRNTTPQTRITPQKQVQRRAIQQTQPTRRTTNSVIKNKQNQ